MTDGSSELLIEMKSVGAAATFNVDPAEVRVERVPGAEGRSVRSPVGVVLRFTSLLEGLKDEPITLHWELIPRSGQALGRAWTGTVNGTLRAGTDKDTGSFKLWIPLPAKPGKYRADVGLLRGHSTLTTQSSEDFE